MNKVSLLKPNFKRNLFRWFKIRNKASSAIMTFSGYVVVTDEELNCIAVDC